MRAGSLARRMLVYFASRRSAEGPPARRWGPTRWGCLLALLASLLFRVDEAADRPLVDPGQIQVPWPKHSHYKQPWRGWLETPPADVYRRGLGIGYNWSVDRANHDVEMRLLSEIGFSRIRVEVGWSNVEYETDDLTNEAKARLTAIVTAAARAGIRPLILLNAHHGVPGPYRELKRAVTVDLPAGSRQLVLDDVSDLKPGYTGLSNLTGFKMAEVLVTAADPAARTVSLSKPLPVPLKAGQELVLHTLKYRPLFEPGTLEYEATLQGWLAYVRAVARTVRLAGAGGFDVEIWNELTFGSDFLSAAAYYDPPLHQAVNPVLLEGGRLWEMGRRTVDLLAREFPEALPIWGFSNVTFFGTPIRALPSGTRGQSYHPYFFITYESIADEQYGFANNLEKFAPAAPPYRAFLPEGAATFLKTESLARLLNPIARKVAPPGSPSFEHLMTEFGVSPADNLDARAADLIRAKTFLRGSLFWLNKGLKGIWLFSDFDEMNGKGYDILPPEIARLSEPPSSLEPYVSLPLGALRNVTRAFRSVGTLSRPRALDLAVAALDGRGGGIVFPGDRGHPPLTYEDVFTALPFQLDNTRFMIAVYVMSRNILEPIVPTSFVLTVANLDGRVTSVRCLDPLLGTEVPVQVRRRTRSAVEIVLSAVDYPYLLDLREGGPPAGNSP